jgi:hypothetical protein
MRRLQHVLGSMPLPRTRRRAALGVGLCACALAACAVGSPADPEADQVTSAANAPFVCPQQTPARCPAPEPSWSGQIEGIVASVCGQCHADGGVEQSAFDFSTYEYVFIDRGPIFSQVASCAMPPSDGGVMFPSDERAALLAWLVCNAPNN